MSELKKVRTYRELYQEGKKRLAAAGLAEADTDARLLLLYITGLRWNELLLRYEEPAAGDAAERYFAAAERRAAHEPLQYIIRGQNFCGLDLYVDERVLIPRQDTEVLVAAAAQDSASWSAVRV